MTAIELQPLTDSTVDEGFMGVVARTHWQTEGFDRRVGVTEFGWLGYVGVNGGNEAEGLIGYSAYDPYATSVKPPRFINGSELIKRGRESADVEAGVANDELFMEGVGLLVGNTPQSARLDFDSEHPLAARSVPISDLSKIFFMESAGTLITRGAQRLGRSMLTGVATSFDNFVRGRFEQIFDDLGATLAVLGLEHQRQYGDASVVEMALPDAWRKAQRKAEVQYPVESPRAILVRGGEYWGYGNATETLGRWYPPTKFNS